MATCTVCCRAPAASRALVSALALALAPALALALVLTLTLTLALVLTLALPGLAHAQDAAAVLPSFAELETAGARIGQIHVLNRGIFDTDDPNEDKLLFRWANALHIRTREGVIRDALLFKTGEPLSVVRIDETERLLRSTRYLYDVSLRPVAMHDGVVDIEVMTRDTWTLDPGLSLGRSGGVNSGGINLREYNLLGSAVAVSFGHSRDVDRSSNEFEISTRRAFDGWTELSYSRAQNSDGSREAVSVLRPFYSLDTRWSAGAKASRDDRLEPIYQAGEVASEYRHQQNLAEVIGGWSTGRVDGFVQRYSIGFEQRDDRYAFEPGSVPPPRLPPDEKRVGPFLRYELVEDRFEKVVNRNQVGRPEFFALGLEATVQIGRAAQAFGSSNDAWLYSASVSRGYEPVPRHTLLGSASISGQYTGGRIERQQLGGVLQYFKPQSERWLFYAGASADVLTHPGPVDMLMLGGDNGLRGYPLRYRAGNQRALFTMEERGYSNLYLFRLFRFGAAAFVDVGRAWGGPYANGTDPGWLADAGVGLRIFSVRAAFSNVLHADVAFPLGSNGDIKKVQFLLKTKTSF